MSIVINSNMTASHAALNMSRASDLLKKSMRRLSSGQRIVNPSDDAGGLAVGLKLQSQMRRTAATKLNIQNGVSFLQMQDGAMKVAGEILDRMAELKSFFNDVSKNALDRENYNYEFRELQRQLVELQASKFNGVSLFATVEPDNNPLKIITTEDGLTGKVELNRTGLFENLKSKWGADGELNSGSHGSFRQLVGEFTHDGGLNDADPGQTSRDYASGEVVYVNGATEQQSGYFLALTNVRSGTTIEDSGKATSKWIRLADKGGKGFAEAFPQSEEYNHSNIKYSTNGERVAYLKDDVVKVPAHWGSPGSYLYLKANTDVPRGITLEQLFSGGFVGDSGYMSYVGQDRSGGATTGDKPTTEYVRTNSNLPNPSVYGGAAADLKALMKFNASNNHTPGYVKSGNDVYVPNHDWDVKAWASGISVKEGEIIFDENPGTANEHVKEISDKAKGTYSGIAYAQNDYVLHQGKWFQASASAAAGAVPVDPASVAKDVTSNATDTAFVAGNHIKDAAGTTVYEAPSTMNGDLDLNNITWGSWVRNGTTWVQLAPDAATAFGGNNAGTFLATTVDYANNAIVEYTSGGVTTYYQNSSGGNLDGTAGTLTDPATDTANWTQVVAADVVATPGAGGALAAGWNAANVAAHWTENPWTYEADPQDQSDFATDVTDTYRSVTNTDYWTKTHYGQLEGITVSDSYTRGDNIFYQGKHYVYVSHLDSNDPSYVSPTNDGYTEFEDLLRLGAVRELSMYVDTKGGGGGAGLQEGVYYRPDQDLEYVDRLPNSGTVRTNSINRRTDAPLPPGDDIYNSADDQFYGGLNAGNDGIFGTMDDFYATTSDPNIASAGAHVDADSDNNKNLLDESNKLQNFSVADFVDFIQSLANFRAINGGTMSRLGYAEDMLEDLEDMSFEDLRAEHSHLPIFKNAF